jgi:integrase
VVRWKPKSEGDTPPATIDKHGMVPKYTGMHCLRHFYASWCINRIEDGGCGLPAKIVQERMGHSKISVTLDIYGHLFPRGDDGGALDRAAEALLG